MTALPRIRPAEPADQDELAALDALAWSPDSGFPSVIESAEGSEFFTAANPPAAHLVAELGGRVVGYIRLKAPTPLPENAHVVQVQGLAVHPAARNGGVASALLAAAERHASEQGARKLSLRVLSTNSAAIRVYERHGFATEGVLVAEFRIAGADVDDVLMAKHLGAPG